VFPPISVIIPTYDRPWLLKKTLESLQENLVYRGLIKYYLGFDGENGTGKMFSGNRDIIAIPGPNNGLGANLNRLIHAAESDLLFQLDDDHALCEPLRLDWHVMKLLEDETSGWIRFMGVAYHDYYGLLDGEYWRVLWKSPDLYIPSNRPHLKHRRFHDYFGLYEEGITLAETEEEFCKRCKIKATERRAVTPPDVLIPLDNISERGWNHSGKSWQIKGR